MHAMLQVLEVPACIRFLRFRSGIQAHPQKPGGLSDLILRNTHSAPAAGSGGFKSSCQTGQPYCRSVGCRGDLGDRAQPSYPAVKLAVPIPWWVPPERLVRFLLYSGYWQNVNRAKVRRLVLACAIADNAESKPHASSGGDRPRAEEKKPHH